MKSERFETGPTHRVFYYRDLQSLSRRPGGDHQSGRSRRRQKRGLARDERNYRSATLSCMEHRNGRRTGQRKVADVKVRLPVTGGRVCGFLGGPRVRWRGTATPRERSGIRDALNSDRRLRLPFATRQHAGAFAGTDGDEITGWAGAANAMRQKCDNGLLFLARPESMNEQPG